MAFASHGGRAPFEMTVGEVIYRRTFRCTAGREDDVAWCFDKASIACAIVAVGADVEHSRINARVLVSGTDDFFIASFPMKGGHHE